MQVFKMNGPIKTCNISHIAQWIICTFHSYLVASDSNPKQTNCLFHNPIDTFICHLPIGENKLK